MRMHSALIGALLVVATASHAAAFDRLNGTMPSAWMPAAAAVGTIAAKSGRWCDKAAADARRDLQQPLPAAGQGWRPDWLAGPRLFRCDHRLRPQRGSHPRRQDPVDRDAGRMAGRMVDLARPSGRGTDRGGGDPRPPDRRAGNVAGRVRVGADVVRRRQPGDCAKRDDPDRNQPALRALRPRRSSTSGTPSG